MTDTTDIKALREALCKLKSVEGLRTLAAELIDQLEAERQRADKSDAMLSECLESLKAAEKELGIRSHQLVKADASVADLEKRLRYTEEALIAATDLHVAALKGDQVPVGFAVMDENHDWHIDFCGKEHALSHGDSLFTAPQKPTTDQMIEWLEGMEVSVDVSTCDADHGNRLFGKVTEVSELDGAKNGVILLVQEPEANFTAPQKPVVLPDGYKPSLQRGGQQSTSYRAIMAFHGDWLHRDMVIEAIEAAGGIVKDGE